MVDPFFGQLSVFGFPFTPQGYYACNGQLVSVYANQGLAAVFGNTYGGDGRTTIGVPNLIDKMMVGYGQSPKTGTVYDMADIGTSNTFTMDSSNMWTHSHKIFSLFPVNASDGADTDSPVGNYYGIGDNNFTSAPTNVLTFMNEMPITVGSAGVAQPAAFSMQTPYVVMNICIACEGLFPPRG